jgi:hypothetical protein
MTCLFCGQPVSTEQSRQVYTCTSCDKPAIARKRLKEDRYDRDASGKYTPHSVWLRTLDKATVPEMSGTTKVQDAATSDLVLALRVFKGGRVEIVAERAINATMGQIGALHDAARVVAACVEDGPPHKDAGLVDELAISVRSAKK